MWNAKGSVLIIIEWDQIFSFHCMKNNRLNISAFIHEQSTLVYCEFVSTIYNAKRSMQLCKIMSAKSPSFFSRKKKRDQKGSVNSMGETTMSVRGEGGLRFKKKGYSALQNCDTHMKMNSIEINKSKLSFNILFLIHNLRYGWLSVTYFDRLIPRFFTGVDRKCSQWKALLFYWNILVD